MLNLVGLKTFFYTFLTSLVFESLVSVKIVLKNMSKLKKNVWLLKDASFLIVLFFMAWENEYALLLKSGTVLTFLF